MKPHGQDDSRIAEEAARWLVRLEEDQGHECRAAFVAWLKHSPRHMEELLLTDAAYSQLDGIDPKRRINVRELLADSSADVIALYEGSEQHSAPAKRLFSQRWRTAITVAAAICGLGVLGWLALYLQAAEGQTFTTAIGEQRSIRLEDGSVVHLNTQSRADVNFSEHVREIRLVAGEALFVVAHDNARPFRVAAGTAIVQAIGTQFNVYRRPDGTTVSVMEGRVRVFAPEHDLLRVRSPGGAGWLEPNTPDLDNLQPPTQLDAGEEANVTERRIVKRAVVDSASAVAWRQRQLVFRSDTLAEVIEQVNRYNRMQLRIADPEVAARRLSGVFDVDDLGSLLEFLKGDGDLSFDFDLEAQQVTIRANAEQDRLTAVQRP